MIKKMWKNTIDTFLDLPLFLKCIVSLCILTGTWFRLEGLTVDGYYFDMVETQYIWGREAWNRGIVNFWQTFEGHYDYPVISLLYEYFLYGITSPFVDNQDRPWYLFVAVHKLFNWIIEIGFIVWVAFLAHNYTQIKEQSLIVLGSVMYSLPALWFVSGVWGQNDLLITWLGLFAIYMFFERSLNKLDLSPKDIVWYKDMRFYAGAIWAASLFVKQQTLLLAPLFALLFILNTSKKEFFKLLGYIIPISVIFGVGGYFYTQNMLELSAIWVGACLTLILPVLFILSRTQSYWQQLWRFLFGWFSVTWFCSVPWLFIDYYRLARVNFAFALRGDSISSGAPNIWTMIGSSNSADALILNTSWSLSISHAAYLLFIIIFVASVIHLFEINIREVFSLRYKSLLTAKAVTFDVAVYLLLLINTSYYFILPGGHSRYLHISVLSWVVFFVLKKLPIKVWLIPWLLLTVGYTFNQVGVYTAVPSHDPQWVQDTARSLQFNGGMFGGVLMLVASTWLFSLALGVLRQNHESDESSSVS